MSAKQTIDLNQPELYINRELSWLEFNRRVLEMGMNDSLPPMERLKFLAIFSSNLDEFFMIRVAGLMQRVEAGVQSTESAGLTAGQLLEQIGHRVRELTALHTEAIKTLWGELRKYRVTRLHSNDWTLEQRRYLADYFDHYLLPLLTPMAVQELAVPPLLPSLQLHLGITLSQKQSEQKRLLVVPVPTVLNRFITLPSNEGSYVVLIEEVLKDHIGRIYREYTIESVDVFRITRDADVTIQGDDAADLLEAVEAAVLERRRRAAVRIELTANVSPTLRQWILDHFELSDSELYYVDGILDARCFWELTGRGEGESIRWPDWPAQKPLDLVGFESIWDAVSDHDVMLVHPYESFEPIIKLTQEAADDPNVLAIKQTLYRTSPDSPIIDALEQAALGGKEVTVLVELKARFDEARNVQWARRLEDAGCYVLYGVAGLKTHAKALLIIRREGGMIKRYVHLSTGNYNDKTARMYSDIGLISSDGQLASDVSAFFNLLTGFSDSVGWSKITIAPTSLRRRLLGLIEREIKAGSPDRPGLIMIKANSLEDKEICQALYRAGMNGVKICLNIRGICCLRPGIKGISEHIEVVSILDRYLEHARIYYFGNGGHSEIYLSSADMMGRNLDRRIELFFPVTSETHRNRLCDMLEIYFTDNANAWRLASDGKYEPVQTKGEKIRSQQVLFEQIAGISQLQKAKFRFRPVRQTENK